MTVDLRAAFLTVNKAYHGLWSDRFRYNLVYGGAGSGKSYAVAQRMVWRLICEAGHNFLVVRKTAVSNSRSTWPLFFQVVQAWGVSHLFEVNKTERSITVRHNGNGAVFVGLDDVEKLKSITFQSGPATDVWVEEATEISEGDLDQLDLRLRGETRWPPQITLTFNPISFHHWLRSRFFGGRPDVTILKTTFRSNPKVGAAYQELMDRLSGQSARVYRDGEWGLAEGLVLTGWTVEPVPAQARLLGYGLDWGFASDPAAVVAVYQSGRDVWLDEVLYQTGLTNADLMAELARAGVSKRSEIVADSAEPKSIEELHRAGWLIKPAIKGADSVRFGLQTMAAMSIRVSPRSTNLIKELSAYSWKTDRDGRIVPEPVDAYNHAIDAARYRLTYKTPKVKAANLAGLGL